MTDDLRAFILEEHSKARALKIAAWVGRDGERFAELMRLFLTDEYRVTQRAAWGIRYAGSHAPELIGAWMPTMVDFLKKKDVPEAVKRCIVGLFAEIEPPDELLGELADLCFGFLADPHEGIAVRVYSMTVLLGVCRKEPELIGELRGLIEPFLEVESPAFRSRGKKVLADLKKIST